MFNSSIQSRLDELIKEGERLHGLKRSDSGPWRNVVELIQWFTSCLNLLDKLSVSTNRFVIEFEKNCKDGALGTVNQSGALGVLKAAREEYFRGLATDYHLSVANSVFGQIIDQAEYLLERGYARAAAVLIGAALEEALRSRAHASRIPLPPKPTLTPLIHSLKSPEIGIIREIDARYLEAIVKIRNDAAHGGAFTYSDSDVRKACQEARGLITNLLVSHPSP